MAPWSQSTAAGPPSRRSRPGMSPRAGLDPRSNGLVIPPLAVVGVAAREDWIHAALRDRGCARRRTWVAERS
jgi:hypothetical protein